MTPAMTPAMTPDWSQARRVPTRMAPDLYAAAVLIASHGDAA